MRLYRELGIMALDPEGQWIEFPIGEPDGELDGADDSDREELPLPPMVPVVWSVPPRGSGASGRQTQPANESDELQPVELRALPPTANDPALR
jgi:hypothetical protein